MASSGEYGLDPELAQYVDEAAERVGIDPLALTSRHIVSARRSAGFVLSTWANRGHRQWKFEQYIHTTTPGETSFDLPEGTIDVQTMVLRRFNMDSEMYPISREDYLLLHDKNLRGRPDRYHTDRRRDTDANTRVQIRYWQAGENDTDEIVMNIYRQVENVGRQTNTLDIPFRFQEAFISALTAKLAEKFKPELFESKALMAEREFLLASGEDRDPAPLTISVAYGRRHYGRR